jgi:hypothetical protein
MATRDRSHTAERNGKPAARAAELPMPQNDRDAKPSPADGDRANAFPIHGAEARLAARMSESLAVPTATSADERLNFGWSFRRRPNGHWMPPRKRGHRKDGR